MHSVRWLDMSGDVTEVAAMQCQCSPPPRSWTRDRVARLGFLVGLGLDVEGIAHDPAVDTTPGNVRRQANRFGLALRATADRRLPPDICERLDAAARRRGLSREALIRALVLVAGSDPTLIDNILDDDA